MYNRERIIRDIEEQLAPLDLDQVRSKAGLIYERSIGEIREEIEKGSLSLEDLTAYYLDRILSLDQRDIGIGGISEVNSQAIEEARRLDRKTGRKGRFYGVLFTVKENISTRDMITSSGLYLLRDFIPARDAAIVDYIRQEDGIILGKTNLTELANFVDPRLPQGYSSKHGETLYPYRPFSLSPSGSSSGAATSTSLNIGGLALGTETTGSIIAPGSRNSVLAYKASLGYLPMEGIMPLSSSLDCLGLMARNMEDLILFYNGISPNKERIGSLEENYLKGKRLAILNPTSLEFKRLETIVEKLGASLIGLDFPEDRSSNMEIILNDFKFDLEAYLRENDYPFRSLEELIDYNRQDPNRRAKYGQRDLLWANSIEARNSQLIEEKIGQARESFEGIFKREEIDCLIYKEDQYIGLASLAGAASLSLPFGLDPAGLPKGLSLNCPRGQDRKLLEYGLSFYREAQGRQLLTDQEILDRLDGK